ncbi:polyketide cyclase [Mycobacteriaceae bacterium 1482268.1]|nr:polyketide cyclase [Mycobacteriaceae bacterium 1482268.1]
MSGRTFSFEVNRTSTAPAATLFRLEADGTQWARWGKPLAVQSGWVRQGDPAPAGVGAVRKVGLWPFLVREETIEYEQDRRHVYELIGPPSPAKGYRAEFLLTPNTNGGTDIRWSGSFTEGLRGTGPIMRAGLRSAIRFFSRRLVAAAEREG